MGPVPLNLNYTATLRCIVISLFALAVTYPSGQASTTTSIEPSWGSGLLDCAPHPDPNNPFQSIEEAITVGDGAAQRALAATNIEDFCKSTLETVTAANQYTAGLSQNSSVDTTQARIANALGHADFENTVLAKEVISLGPWSAALYPNEKFRLLAYHKGIERDLLGPDATISQIRKFLERYPGSESVLKPTPTTYDTVDQLANKSGDQASAIKRSNTLLVKLGVCVRYGLTTVASCEQGMSSILAEMTPKAGDYVLLGTIKEVLHDPIYAEGARRTALKVMDRVESTAPTAGHLFDDMYQSFREEGLDAESAKEHTWNLLAVASSEGSNTSVYLDGIKPDESMDAKKQAILCISIGVITTGSSVLDHRTFSSGHPYSYPADVESTCDNGKPYHFWMTAYWARRLKRELGSAEAARSAAWLSEQGYQMRSTSFGRDPSRAFQVESFDPQNNAIRMDLAVAAAAAVYGASSDSSKLPDHLNIDQGLRELIINSKPQERLNKQDADGEWNSWMGVRGYRRWDSLFAPDSAFNYFLNQ
jgi:hypothetical protein